MHGQTFKHITLGACVESGGRALCILNLGIVWMCSASCYGRFIVRKASPENAELGGLESCSERSAEEVGFFLLPVIEPH
jgi:hypothetical protein